MCLVAMQVLASPWCSWSVHGPDSKEVSSLSASGSDLKDSSMVGQRLSASGSGLKDSSCRVGQRLSASGSDLKDSSCRVGQSLSASGSVKDSSRQSLSASGSDSKGGSMVGLLTYFFPAEAMNSQ